MPARAAQPHLPLHPARVATAAALRPTIRRALVAVPAAVVQAAAVREAVTRAQEALVVPARAPLAEVLEARARVLAADLLHHSTREQAVVDPTPLREIMLQDRT